MRLWLCFYILLAGLGLTGQSSGAGPVGSFLPGDAVALTRSETLLFKGENFLGAPKGQEFSVLQNDPAHGAVYVGFYKPDGTLIAVSLPADALEPAKPNPWRDLLRGLEAFRDGRYDEQRRLFAIVAQDAAYKPMATMLAQQLTAATTAPSPAAIEALRRTATQFCKDGNLSLGLAIDRGADRIAARVPGAPPSAIDQADVAKRVDVATRSTASARQAAALHRLAEALKWTRQGLEAEPTRPDLMAMQARIQREYNEAEDRWKDADRMRRIHKGEVHALTALERGLKLCVDHPGLQELKREMQGALESRTAPKLTPAMLKTASSSAPLAELEEGRTLYTTRCTECHDLEMLDSRSVSGWEKAVAGMARRAHLDSAKQARIMAYISVASKVATAD